MSIPHIAIVEDHLPDVLAFRESLARRGIAFTLDHYTDGETAARAFAGMTVAPDVVVLDLHVPRIDGFELLGRVRNNPVTRAVPVLVLTSSGAEADRMRAQQYGADLYLVKPSAFTEFLNAVAAAIQSLLAGRPQPLQDPAPRPQGSGKASSAERPR